MAQLRDIIQSEGVLRQAFWKFKYANAWYAEKAATGKVYTTETTKR